MNKREFIIGFIFLCPLLFHRTMAQGISAYEYLSPKPNSEYIHRETAIIVRSFEKVNHNVCSELYLFTVIGSKSGAHSGRIMLSDDERTLVFTPLQRFEFGEKVTVKVQDGLPLWNSKQLTGTTFHFTIMTQPATDINRGVADILDSDFGMKSAQDSLPADFPWIRIDTLNNPASGNIFLANFGPVSGTGAYGNYLMILDNSGRPAAYKKISSVATTFAYNFTAQPNGLISYIEKTLTASTIRVMDTTMKVIDSFQGGNGYTGDLADFRILPNGHVVLLMYDWQIVDMSKFVVGGYPAATIAQAVIQELDINKNVVFQWRSFDYIPITDSYSDSLAMTIDYIHANGLEIDKDGGILLSSRHLSEITKINGSTGEIIWRLGGKKNQFTFVGEHEASKPNYFSYQHDVSRLENGNIMLFDNGNQHTPQYSRVVEYAVDEVNKVAALIWEFRRTPEIFASANGSAQRLPNGNTFIGWGNAGLDGLTSITEVHPDKSIAFELTLPKGQRTWRAYRFPWKENQVAASYTHIDILQGNTYSFNGLTNDQRTGLKIIFQLLQPIFYNTATVKKYSTAPSRPQFTLRAPQVAATRFTITRSGMTSFTADLMFDVTMLKDIPDPDNVKVYRRDTVDNGKFFPLPTSYNPVTKEILATTSQFGEFIFGRGNDDIAVVPPILFFPVDKDSINRFQPLVVKWNPKGYQADYHLQVATDSSFKSLVLNDSTLTIAADTMKSFSPNSKYYWRVRSGFGLMKSAWSPMWSFTAVGPYIAVLSPKAQETLVRGKSYNIVWHTNISEKVRIDLYKSGTRYSLIKDSVTNIGAYPWAIPASLPIDSGYSFRIRSIIDTLIVAFSSNTCKIGTATGITDEMNLSVREYQLYQNYPNPFNSSTTISFQLQVRSRIRLEIYNLTGQRVASFIDREVEAGTHKVIWRTSEASGIYFCHLEVTDLDKSQVIYSQTNKILLLR
ncbi:MAG: aryl-sulfate sulfotransferase [bacterium]